MRWIIGTITYEYSWIGEVQMLIPTMYKTNFFNIFPGFIFQMSYGAASVLLSDTDKYPLFTRTYPSLGINNLAILKLLENFGWRKIAVIAMDTVYTATVMDILPFLVISF